MNLHILSRDSKDGKSMNSCDRHTEINNYHDLNKDKFFGKIRLFTY